MIVDWRKRVETQEACTPQKTHGAYARPWRAVSQKGP